MVGILPLLRNKDGENQTFLWQTLIFSLLAKKRQKIRPYSKNMKNPSTTYSISLSKYFYEERT